MRIGLLATAQITPFYQNVIASLLQSPQNHVVIIAVDERRTSARHQLLVDLRKGRGGYVLVKIARRLFLRADVSTPIEALAATIGATIVRTTTPNSTEIATRIASEKPDVLIRIGGYGGIIKSTILQSAPLGVLSFHHGDMRRFRGAPAGFWELYHGEREMGVTVQRLVERLDAGGIVAEQRIPIEYGQSWKSLLNRAYAESAGLMAQAVQRIGDSTFVPPIPETLGPVYSEPNLRKWMQLQFMIAFRNLRRRLGWPPSSPSH